MKNLRVREIDGKFRVVSVNSEGRIIATHKDSYNNAKEALEKMHELETQRPKVNDIVKIYCSSIDMPWYYGRVTEVKSLGIVVDTTSSIGKAYFSFAANCIVVVGHEETRTNEGWAYIGNFVEAER